MEFERWRKDDQEKGTVMCVVLSGMTPATACFMAGIKIGGFRFMFDGAAVCARHDGESYLVVVPAPGLGRPRLYWPRVSALRKVGT